ncbi:MAG TPA: phosphate--acyl-ACP acyltransferase, partial [Flavihumibacter sp.]|nr:phosphate--acyl-ACP acyltransferase [Flavihumibacter sp.]
MTIGLDMMGGDYAPLEAVKGLQLFLLDSDAPATVFLFGDEAVLQPLLQEHAIP